MAAPCYLFALDNPIYSDCSVSLLAPASEEETSKEENEREGKEGKGPTTFDRKGGHTRTSDPRKDQVISLSIYGGETISPASEHHRKRRRTETTEKGLDAPDEKEGKEQKIGADGKEDKETKEEYKAVKSLKACKVLLAGHSSFFKTAIESKMGSGIKEGEITVTMSSSLESDTMAKLIACMHTSGIERVCNGMSGSQMFQLLMCADKLGALYIAKECAHALGPLLTVDLCVLCMELPSIVLRTLHGQIVSLSVFDFIVERWCKDFEVKWNTSEFHQLPLPLVSAILSSQYLRVRSENTIFQAIAKWWAHNVSTLGSRSISHAFFCLPAPLIPSRGSRLVRWTPSEPSQPIAVSIEGVEAPTLPTDGYEVLGPKSSIVLGYWNESVDKDEKIALERAASTLLSCVRYHHLTSNFFSDVVQSHRQLSPFYNIRAIHERLKQAARFHSYSEERKKGKECAALSSLWSKRFGSTCPTTTECTWEVTGLAENSSPPFWLDGYCFFLETRDSSTLDLFFALDLAETETLSTLSPFPPALPCGEFSASAVGTCTSSLFVQVDLAFEAYDHAEQTFKPLERLKAVFDRSSISHRLSDVFKQPRSELTPLLCPYVGPNDSVIFRVTASLCT